MKNLKRITLILLSLSLLNSCSKDDEDINNAPIADFSFSDDIYQISLESNSTDIDNDELTYKWTSDSEIINFSNTTRKNTSISLPKIEQNSVEISVTLSVSDGLDESTITKILNLPKLTQTRELGLGVTVKEEKSNNVNYDWYIDQMNTGTHSDVNCGPSSVTMAVKWANESFDKTAEDARKTYRSDGGWWYTDDMVNYLNKFNVNNKTIALSNTSMLVDEIKKGNIIILCLDMHFITYQALSYTHVDKFYKTSNGWGHFIVLKGYKKVDANIFFEVYDPNSYGKRYKDNTLKGIDRYYRSQDINEATNIWWDFAIVVSKNPISKSGSVNIKDIIHKPGR